MKTNNWRRHWLSGCLPTGASIQLQAVECIRLWARYEVGLTIQESESMVLSNWEQVRKCVESVIGIEPNTIV